MAISLAVTWKCDGCNKTASTDYRPDGFLAMNEVHAAAPLPDGWRRVVRHELSLCSEKCAADVCERMIAEETKQRGEYLRKLFAKSDTDL